MLTSADNSGQDAVMNPPRAAVRKVWISLSTLYCFHPMGEAAWHLVLVAFVQYTLAENDLALAAR